MTSAATAATRARTRKGRTGRLLGGGPGSSGARSSAAASTCGVTCSGWARGWTTGVRSSSMALRLPLMTVGGSSCMRSASARASFTWVCSKSVDGRAERSAGLPPASASRSATRPSVGISSSAYSRRTRARGESPSCRTRSPSRRNASPWSGLLLAAVSRTSLASAQRPLPIRARPRATWPVTSPGCCRRPWRQTCSASCSRPPSHRAWANATNAVERGLDSSRRAEAFEAFLGVGVAGHQGGDITTAALC